MNAVCYIHISEKIRAVLIGIFTIGPEPESAILECAIRPELDFTGYRIITEGP